MTTCLHGYDVERMARVESKASALCDSARNHNANAITIITQVSPGNRADSFLAVNCRYHRNLLGSDRNQSKFTIGCEGRKVSKTTQHIKHD